MPTSGLLLTLNDQEPAVADALREINQCPELTAGDQYGRWLPVALEARDDLHSRTVHDWLMSLPGVEFVDVISVNFETSETLNEN